MIYTYQISLWILCFWTWYPDFFRKRIHEITKIAMPRICCGTDGLEWQRVKQLIRTVFARETNVEILVCSHNQPVVSWNFQHRNLILTKNLFEIQTSQFRQNVKLSKWRATSSARRRTSRWCIRQAQTLPCPAALGYTSNANSDRSMSCKSKINMLAMWRCWRITTVIFII